MKILDYFYDEFLTPVFDEIKSLIQWVYVFLLGIVLYLTCPIWIIPYLVIKHRKKNKTESGEENEKNKSCTD